MSPNKQPESKWIPKPEKESENHRHEAAKELVATAEKENEEKGSR